MAYDDVYTVMFDNQTVASAKILLEVTAGSTHGVEVLRAWIGQDTRATSGMEEVTFCSFSSGGTGGTSATIAGVLPNAPTADATAKYVLTSGGSIDRRFVRDPFNVLNGWLWIPTLKERPRVPPNGRLGLVFEDSVTTASWFGGIIFREV